MSKYTTAVLLIVTEARSSTNYKILSKVFVEMSSSLSGKLNKSYYIQIQPFYEVDTSLYRPKGCISTEDVVRGQYTSVYTFLKFF